MITNSVQKPKRKIVDPAKMDQLNKSLLTNRPTMDRWIQLRNARLFTTEETDKSSLLKITEGNTKLQLMCLNVKKSAQVMRIAQR